MSLFFWYSNVQGYSFYYRGSIEAKYSHYDLKNDTLLNPNRDLSAFSTYQYFLEPDFVFELNNDKGARLVAKTRIPWKKNTQEHDSEIVVDNLYADITIFPELFLTVGKFNLQDGVGLSYNPSSFLEAKKTIDYSKSEEEQKQDQEGLYLARVEWIQENYTLSLVTIPGISSLQEENTGVLSKLSTTFDSYDLAFHYYHGDYPLFGTNFSSTIGDSLGIHWESGLKKGSQQKILTTVSEIIPASGIYSYDTAYRENEDQIYIKNLIGGNYTFPNKLNLIVEYYYNQEGYSNKEWQDFIDIVSANNNYYLNPPFSLDPGIFSQNLGLANFIMNYKYMRENYLFFRASYPEFLGQFNLTLALLFNIDDKSSVAMPGIKYAIDQQSTVALSWSIFSGKADSEFGLLSWHNEGRIIFSYFL